MSQSNFYRNLIVWMFIGIGMMLVFNSFKEQKQAAREISYTEFLAAVDNNLVQSVTVKGQKISGEFKEEVEFLVKDKKTAFKEFSTLGDARQGFGDAYLKNLASHGVSVRFQDVTPGFLETLLVSWGPMLLIFGVIIWFYRKQMGGGANGAMAFGKSKAKEIVNSKKTFADVAGCDEAKEDLREIVDMLKNPKKYTRLGGRMPKGVLLEGAPGTGKTLLAAAVAGEAGVPFFSISGSDFVEMFVGVGAARIRNLFVQGKKSAPCIIFIDELDAVGGQRGAGIGNNNDERNQTLNQLLVEMDGIEDNENIILIAATNRSDMLDAALKRPGRFTRKATLPLPDIKGRKEIFEVHVKSLTLASDVNLEVLAKGTAGFTGAGIADMCNEAAFSAARNDKEAVDMESFEDAKERVLMGAKRRSVAIMPEEADIIAYHEAGHAIVGTVLECDPVYKVSRIPRGMALGVTVNLPEFDRNLYSEETLLDCVATIYGGRAAEKIAMNSITQGASNDIEKATGLLRAMVTQWGMSKELGPVAYEMPHKSIHLGRDLGSQRTCAESTLGKIDDVVQKMGEERLNRAETILAQYMGALNEMKDVLMEKEEIDGDEVRRIVAKHAPQEC